MSIIDRIEGETVITKSNLPVCWDFFGKLK